MDEFSLHRKAEGTIFSSLSALVAIDRQALLVPVVSPNRNLHRRRLTVSFLVPDFIPKVSLYVFDSRAEVHATLFLFFLRQSILNFDCDRIKLNVCSLKISTDIFNFRLIVIPVAVWNAAIFFSF